ncbi:related to monooxygenase [Melanopsichium pennsylvanicum]|uniref:Related to monooxygenase n=2 Tax=Melanopsichium pennsylvanicum TaxID=63383 RepID=A0AAJ4XKN1_9BASI|nr:related to monooxygenase [Melanopsichium pennsylvanicum 4]SNX84109.1 related to monooxygenase [Melanopsichium pennsylvanicum]
MSAIIPTCNQPLLTPEYHEVIIVGAGISGICMACQLKRKHGINDFLILERSPAPSGTWTNNSYPGCACDVPAPVYSFSFATKGDWSTFYPKQKELKLYFTKVAKEHGLEEKFRFQTTVEEARFDKDTGLWHIWSVDWTKDGTEEDQVKHHYVCKFFVSAVGGLSQPKPCDIDGHESFKGPIFHTAAWDHSVSLKGKDVVLVGNGCSATQCVPYLAEHSKTLTQFVRSKHWIAPHPHQPFDSIPGFKWLLQKFVFVRKFQRLLIWLVLESHFILILQNPIGRLFRWNWRRKCEAHMKKNAPKEYWDMLLPRKDELMVGCKRRIIDDNYLPALRLPHVRVENTKLARIESNHVVLTDGRKIHADVIVMANGFEPHAAGAPMTVYGTHRSLHDHWEKYGEGGMIAYRSALNSGFPNMGSINAANTGTGNQSLIFASECTVNLLLEIAKPVLAAAKPPQFAIEHIPGTSADEKLEKYKIPTVEVKLKAELDEQHWIAKCMEKLVFTSGCKSWYIDQRSGRVTSMQPDWQLNYMLRATFPKWDDFRYTGLKGGETRPSDTPWWKVIGDKLGLGHVKYVDPKETPQINRAAMGA